jgi:hypothetical protein
MPEFFKLQGLIFTDTFFICAKVIRSLIFNFSGEQLLLPQFK